MREYGIIPYNFLSCSRTVLLYNMALRARFEGKTKRQNLEAHFEQMNSTGRRSTEAVAFISVYGDSRVVALTEVS